MDTQTNTCPCPAGYTLDASGNNCVRTVTSIPTLSPTIYTVGPGNKNTNYGSQGVNFYEDISNKPYPIGFGTSTSLVDGSGNPLSITNTVSNSFWGYYPSVNPPYYGRLNNCGVWTTLLNQPFTAPIPCASGYSAINDLPTCEWIGFSKCLHVEQTGTYCIGLGADNFFRLKVNGQLVVQFDVDSTFSFNKWHVFPITLNAGANTIALEGLNIIQFASFGAEIYNASPSTLATITTQTALTAVTVFTTADEVGKNFQTGQNSGYICPDGGCTLNLCSQPIVCTCVESIPVPVCCFQLTNCVTGAVIITSTDLTANIGQTITIQEASGCWQVTSATTCNGSTTVTVTAAYTDCVACLPCFKLTNCANSSQFFYTNIDLTSYVGGVIQIQRSDICWSVSASTGCTQTTPVGVVSSYSDCPTCLCKYYLLVDCAGVKPAITTNTNLLAFVGKVIKIQSCPDICWEVACTQDGTGVIPVIQTESYDSCDLCNPPVVVPSPELLRQRRVKPGYNTSGCSPEYTEKINCKFVEQVWDQVKKRRYGISSCSEDEFMRYDIKKQLLDLRAIWDPELCVTCPPITCCTPCPTPEPPTPPIPLTCPLPTDVVVTVTLQTPCEDVPAVNGAQIIFNNPAVNGWKKQIYY